MKLKTNLIILTTFFMLIIFSEFVIGQSEDIVESVEPASIEAGTQNQTFTITLKDLGTPPIPPSEVSPTSITLGSLEGQNINRNELVITTVINVPESETNGFKNLTITFPGPDNNSVSFVKSNAVEVVGGSDPDLVGGLEGEVTLFAPLGNKTTYLIDEDGNEVKTWESEYSPALSAYLLDDKTLLRTASLGQNGNSIFGSTGGAGGLVQQFDWDGNLIWEFEHNSDNYLLHHDIEYLPNGNILMIAWEYKSEQEAIDAGRDPSLLNEGELWPDKIIEVMPEGTNSGTIVWEWHVWDHLIQEYDSTKENYGIVSEHPEKINLNFTLNQANADWNHINAVDYNEELDQILLTVRSFSEVWIIDHNLTTEKAAGNAGDLLYRWGNPQTYDRGTSSDQKLFVPHDGQWIEPGHAGENDILVFNNGQGRSDGDYSSVDQFTPPLDGGSYLITSGNSFEPEALTWTYYSNPTSDFYANHISGAQRLSNGNTLICEGTEGRFFEVTSTGEIVWEYINPYIVSSPQGDNNTAFRAIRYNLDDPNDEDNPPVPEGLTYPIVDTGQDKFYDLSNEISAPSKGEDFYGQDAQFTGYQPSYTLSQDGLTVYDNVTGLTWTQSADLNRDNTIDVDDKLSFDEALTYHETLNSENFGGFSDWRLPSMKELYSLMNFNGTDPSGPNPTNLTPFIDTTYFDFAYGDESAGERLIDAQFWSTNAYVGKVFVNQSATFGLNLGDGRIKGYPTEGMVSKVNYLYFVRGNTSYGINNFIDNSDGTVTDSATGLMWMQDDYGNNSKTGPRSGISWKDALAWVEEKNDENYLGYNNWRLPNAKEMQSLVDYSRAPDATSSASIDPIFNITEITNEGGEIDYPWFWTGTTHARNDGLGTSAVYICFGRATGYMNNAWIDVHGAGCQRSDQKSEDLSSLTYVDDGYYFDQSPQGDATRSYNYVRLVRGAEITDPTNIENIGDNLPTEFKLNQNYPNPFNPSTQISVGIPESGNYTLRVYNTLGQEVAVLLNDQVNAGTHTFNFNASHLSSGFYFYAFSGNNFTETKKMLLLK